MPSLHQIADLKRLEGFIMGDILVQYDWNNHKVMNGERLYNLFCKASLSDKAKVYRALKPKRRKLLKKVWSNQRNQRENTEKKKRFQELVSNALSPFGYLNNEDIKNHNELLLTIGLLYESFTDTIEYEEDKHRNASKGESDFQKEKAKMIDWLDILLYREGISTINKYQDLCATIEGIEYVPPFTLAQQLKFYKSDYSKLYRALEVGDDRAKRIASALSDIVKSVAGATTAEIVTTKQHQSADLFNVWLDSLPDNLISEALKFMDELHTN